MSVENHRVLIGACGWQHPAWSENFYDEDLPEDWQLGFYSNEFSVVYVPAADWLNVDDVNEWTEEVADSFRFILEIPADFVIDSNKFADALSKAKKTGDFCLGFIFHVNQDVVENVNIFKNHLEKAVSFTNVCIDKGDSILPAEINKIVNDNNISEVWNGVSDNFDSLKRGSLAVSHVFAEDMDMNELRKVVEVCLSASTEQCISVLCLDGNPPSLEVMRNADIILNLL